MRLLTIAGVVLLCAAPGAPGEQSLAEVAHKEKERRNKNTAAVTLIDHTTLDGYDRKGVEHVAASADETGPQSNDAATPDTEAVEEPAAVAAREAQARAERIDCSQRLKVAQAELKHQVALLRQGVILWGEAATTYGGYTEYVGGNGQLVGSAPGYYRYEQGHLSCLAATRNPKRYPGEADECNAIQEKIDEIRAEIGAGCR